MDFSAVLDILQRKETFFVLLGIFACVAIFLVVQSILKNKLKKQFQEIEVRYNALRSIPVLFKLNKANGLAKVNHDVIDRVEETKRVYALLQDDINVLAESLASCEDNIVDNKLKKAKTDLEASAGMFAGLEQRIDDLDHTLDALLEEEAQQRLLITEYKDEFRVIKNLYQQRLSALSYSREPLETQIKEIEDYFTSFEEWMFATEFDKAKEVSAKIRDAMTQLQFRIENLPDLIVKARGVIPQMIGNISESYGYAKDRNVYLDHLEVNRNMEVISETLKEDLTSLKQANLENISDHLAETEQRLEQLKEQIEREAKSHEEVTAVSKQSFDMLSELVGQVNQLRKDVPVIIARFNFKDFEAKVEQCNEQITTLISLRTKLERMMHEESIPASTLLISLREFQQDVELCNKDVNGLLTQIDNANADENRAKKQVLKLHLILNDIQIRIKKHHLPAISNQYEDDLKKSYQYVLSIQRLLEEPVLNVTILNGTVNEAIDYIYRLHNNVNNLIGVVNMAESAIVYANKYRSTFSDINADLNRAELSFRNGEYTQSLTTIIHAIDRHQPGISHEDFIKENSQSA